MDRQTRERLNRGSRPATGQNVRTSSASGHNSGVRNAKNIRMKRRTKGNFKSLLWAIGFALVLVFAGGLAYYIYLQSKMTISETPASLTAASPTEPFNLVIFGSDTRDPDRQARADTIILARIDPVENEMWMVSIPRDIGVELPGHGAQKLNAAYIFGGSDMAIQAVKDVTGQDIHHFVTLNFWGFEGIVDAMGGIEIDVPFAIDDPRGDFTPDKSASQIEPGLQTLSGAHALTFVRHRDGYADGDLGRMRAQQDFFRALGSQLSDVPVWRLPLIANSFADNTTTSMTPFELAMVARGIRGVDSDNLYLTTLPGEWRSPYIVVDEAAAAEVWRNFGTAPFE